jgi:hypothetical protein
MCPFEIAKLKPDVQYLKIEHTINISFVNPRRPENKQLIKKRSSLLAIFVGGCSTEEEGVHDCDDGQLNCRRAIEESANANRVRSTQYPMRDTWWHDA